MDAETQAHCSSIERHGYTILKNVWSPETCAAARSRLHELRDQVAAGASDAVAAGASDGDQSVEDFSAGHLYNKGRVFEGVYQAPQMLQIIRFFLGDDATMMSLGDLAPVGRINFPVPPDESWQPGLHNDGSLTGAFQGVGSPADRRRRITSHVLYLQAIWCLSPFSRERGG